ncbi:PilT/PilU family type 4a pilus ATPase [Patescibacteria group bacterium]|nr:PilT/PilU family type 4a pilus ATPase [Patescibacteria group bacterium]HOM77913.1 PilT/PilU family type 4a pilus ATPase [bacterium]
MSFSAPKILEKMVSLDASDLHLTVGSSPVVRIKRNLSPLSEFSAMTTEDVTSFLQQVLEPDQMSVLEVSRELDFSVSLGSKARFRVNAFYQKGYPSVALRYIPQIIPSLDELNLPPILKGLSNLKQGLVLVVGPAGHGKSTTIASIIELINETRAEHVITLEDPIEYVFTNKKSLIEQRELYVDTASWDNALKSILRQDPDVVFIGEMRDMDTTLAALRIAETGHLVFATLHTNSAAQTVERIIATFPPEKQIGFQSQLSSILEAVVSLRLLPAKDGGVYPAVELMLGTDAIRNIIREGKFEQINNVINTSSHVGMTSLDRSLANLIEKGVVSPDEALRYSLNPDQVRRFLK